MNNLSLRMLLEELSRTNTAHPPLNLQCKNDAQLSPQTSTKVHVSNAQAQFRGDCPSLQLIARAPGQCCVQVVPRLCTWLVLCLGRVPPPEPITMFSPNRPLSLPLIVTRGILRQQCRHASQTGSFPIWINSPTDPIKAPQLLVFFQVGCLKPSQPDTSPQCRFN